MGKISIGTVIAALVVAVLGVLAGCGGNSESSAAPTKAKYLKEVNAACEKGQDKHDQLLVVIAERFERLGQTPKAQEEAVLELQEPYEETTEKLADLTPPEGGEPKVEALIEAREEAAAKVNDDPLVVYKKRPYREVEERAKDADLIECII